MLFAHMYRGAARTCLGRYDAGMSDLNGALEIARSSRDQNAEAMALTGLAFIQMTAADYADGIASARKALEVAEKSGDAMFRYSTNSFIAWGMFGLGNAKESLPYWDAAREAAQPLGGRLLLGEWFAAIEAEALSMAGDAEAGFRRAKEALKLAQNVGSVIGEALAERGLGRALAATGPMTEAQAHLAKASELFEIIGARYDLARSLLAEGEARLGCNDEAGAAALLKKAATVSNECQLLEEESRARALLEKLRAC
jgi:tetratricopeptide (TPR) repeat protein